MNNCNDRGTNLGASILDSRLIVATKSLKYDIKLVDCGDYVQVYLYDKKKSRDNKRDRDSDLSLNNIKILNSIELKEKNKEEYKEKKIEERNIIRSKLDCQRLAKSNMEDWETFVTLTFAENITDIDYANTRLKYFIDKVRRVKKDFKYLCIPEFQKRGATHYHLLTNIPLDDEKLMYIQEDNPNFKHIRYWIDGFTSVEPIKGDAKKIVGYIAKYMTKDIDNRLFNRHRYFYSRNLNAPKENYIDLDNSRDMNFYKKIIQDCNLIYSKEYVNPYDNSQVNFLEYLKNKT